MEKSPDLIEHSIYEKIVLVASAISPKLGMVLQQMSLFCRYGLHQTSTKQTWRNGMFVLLWPASVCVSSSTYCPPHHPSISMSVTYKPTAWDAGHAQLPPNYGVRVIVYFGWKLEACLKPLCSFNHRPCLHTLPIRKVRAPFHCIIQLHQKRFVFAC